MSFPNMTGAQGGAGPWVGYHSHGHPTPPPPPAPQTEDSGMPTRPMGLKVQYTFDKDQQNCLARWPHTLQIQSIPIDERNAIGVIDLRICLEAIAQCSPEIINQYDKDYAVYAVDYSEEDVPLVGQGMLSWGLEQPTPGCEQKLVTGRVVKNMMAVFRTGVPETLEVKLKLNTVAKMHRPQTAYKSEPQRGYGSNAPSPGPMDANSEWSSFVQSNPSFSRPAAGHSMPSPSLAPARYGSPVQAHSPAPESYGFPTVAPTPPPSNLPQSQPVPLPPLSHPPAFQGPAGEDMSGLPRLDEGVPPAIPKPSKRASSKAPKKKTKGTGNPRGRPPKHGRPDSGNTSALEDATDADEANADATTDGPKKKRAKTTKADWPDKGPLSSATGSLRVAASTSGSLRTMRPAASGGNGVGASHLQEIPRAPTPVPGHSSSRPLGRLLAPGQPRRPSVAGADGHMRVPNSETAVLAPPMQNARSPSEAAAQSPYQAYTPDESTGDIGSSPPVPRTTHPVRSSPPPSSPVLPPMPMPPPDSGFMSGGLDDMADEETIMSSAVPPQPAAARPKKSKTSKSKKGQASKLKSKKASLTDGAVRPVSRGISEPTLLPRPTSQGLPEPPAVQPPPMALGLPEPPSSVAPPKPIPQGLPGPPPGTEATLAPPSGPRASKGMVIEHVYPGPPELLPKTSIYNPPALTRNQARANGTKVATRQLIRLNTEPTVQQQGTPQPTATSPPILEHQIPTTDVNTPEVQPSQVMDKTVEDLVDEPTDETMADAPVQSIESQVPSPQTSGPTEDPLEGNDEQLLQLLSGTANVAESDNFPFQSISGLNNSSHIMAQQPLDPCSIGPVMMPQVPASDPGVPAPGISPPADGSQPSKNFSRKKSIKEKLEQAVQMGKMPTFCSNCGAISTPTWRRIWTQDCEGSPEFPVYSDKPGCITAIVILQRDENEKPTKYQVIKKALASTEDKSKWTEDILCNPCGIWLSKFKSQRPEERWEKENKSRPGKTKGARKSRSGQKAATTNLTSEAYFTTDPIGPDDQGPSPPKDGDEVMLLRTTTTEPPSRERGLRSQTARAGDSFDSERHDSTHSRRSGTVQSLAMEEEGLGKTRRLLFPSPKKDGTPKVLGDVAVNVVRMSPSSARLRNTDVDKENGLLDLDMELNLLSTPKIGDDDDMVGLFGTPARPSTPPPKEKTSVPFKTPTRPTPSHRPITRSVSKSIRTVRTVGKSPGRASLQLEQTPTKTPRSSARLRSGNACNNANYSLAHFEESITGGPTIDFCSPFSSTLNQLLSEANEFTAGSSAHGLGELELPTISSDMGLSGHLEGLDFGHFLTTDAVMPSSPPIMGRNIDDPFTDFDGWGPMGDIDISGPKNDGGTSTSAN